MTTKEKELKVLKETKGVLETMLAAIESINERISNLEANLGTHIGPSVDHEQLDMLDPKTSTTQETAPPTPLTEQLAETPATKKGTNVATTISKEDVIQALQEISATSGIEKCQELLNQFNATKVSDIKEDDYPDFIAACAEDTTPEPDNTSIFG